MSLRLCKWGLVESGSTRRRSPASGGRAPTPGSIAGPIGAFVWRVQAFDVTRLWFTASANTSGEADALGAPTGAPFIAGTVVASLFLGLVAECVEALAVVVGLDLAAGEALGEDLLRCGPCRC